MRGRLVLLFCLLACTGPSLHAKKKEVSLPLVQHALHRDYFRGLEVPDLESLLKSGYRHVYPDLNVELVWRGALRLMLQQGILVHVSSETRLIVCVSPLPEVRGQLTDTKPRTFLQFGVPHVLHVALAPSGGTEIVLDWIPDLYRRADQPDVFAVAMTEEARSALTEEFIESLEVEASAATRWRTVFEGALRPLGETDDGKN